MNLGRALAYLYPDAEPGRDYTVRAVEGSAPYIAEWNLPDPQPTEAELEAAGLEVAKVQKVGQMHEAAISELSPLFTDAHGKDELMFVLAAHVKQICEALGIQPDPRLSQVEVVGQKALAMRDEVEAAHTPEELEGISWT
jgi:hypothetical protein